MNDRDHGTVVFSCERAWLARRPNPEPDPSPMPPEPDPFPAPQPPLPSPEPAPSPLRRAVGFGMPTDTCLR